MDSLPPTDAVERDTKAQGKHPLAAASLSHDDSLSEALADNTVTPPTPVPLLSASIFRVGSARYSPALIAGWQRSI